VAGLGLSGCSTHQLASNDKVGDPLLGQTQPPNVQQSTPTQTGSLPPIPQHAGLTTNAALASQTPTGQALAITGAEGWARKVDSAAPAPTGRGTAPTTPVSQPRVEAIPPDHNPTSATIQPTGWTAGSQPAAVALPTTDQIDKQLADHGVIGHNQENVPGGVRLTCVVRSPSNPNSVQNYYTTAVDYPTAAQAIIREIEAQRPH
jgi:hypothetical protein